MKFSKSKLCKTITASAVVIASLLQNLAFVNPAQAVYEERGGVYGEIKYVLICNRANTFPSFKVITEAGSRGPYVSRVDIKMYSAFLTGISFNGFTFGVNRSPAWRQAAEINRTSNDRRWWNTGSLGNLGSTFSENVPIRFAQHVQTSNGTVIDLGGILNMGTVPVGKCKVYDNGNLSIY